MPKHASVNASSLDRRELLRLLGSSVAVTSTVALAGCQAIAGTDDSDGDDGFRAEIEKIDFGAEYERRRGASLEEWPYEKRTQVPTDDVGSSDAWLESESVRSAPWSAPSGWEDTAAADVDTIRFLNYGDMEYDPATAAVDALFERETGIAVERIEVVMDQAIPKAAAFLSQGQSSPHMLQATTSSSMSTYAGAGWLESVDAIMSDDEMWDMYLPICEDTYNWNGHLWGGPGTLEGVPMNVRVDLLEGRNLDGELEKIREGTWTWDDMESVMAAFEGTDVYGFGFRGGSDVDAERDWRILWYQTGGRYRSEDETITIGESGVLALEKLIEWKDNGWLPPDTVGWGEGDLTDAFLSGQVAMAAVATDLVGDATATYEPGEEYIIARMPKGTEGPNPQHATYAGGPVSAINVHASTAQKVACALYQDCRFSEAASWWEYVHEGNMAPATATYEQAEETDAVWMSNVREQVMKDAANEVFPQQREIMQNTSEEIQLAYAGEKTAATAIEDAQSFIDTVLGQ